MDRGRESYCIASAHEFCRRARGGRPPRFATGGLEGLMIPDTLQTLRQVNESLRSALHRLRPEHTHCSAIQPQDFACLLSEIVRAAGCLQSQAIAPVADAALQQESLEYRGNLGKLTGCLPEAHRSLLVGKSRLATD